MAIFGNDSIVGATEDGGGLNSSKGSRFTAPGDGTITQISMYFVDYFGGTADLRVAVYNDNAGRPGTKRAESAGATTVNGANQWFHVAISTTIVNGVDYWLLGWCNTTVANPVTETEDTSNQSTSSSAGTFPTWDSPYSEDSALAVKYSIYADYTPSGSASLFRKSNLNGISSGGPFFADPLGQ